MLHKQNAIITRMRVVLLTCDSQNIQIQNVDSRESFFYYYFSPELSYLKGQLCELRCFRTCKLKGCKFRQASLGISRGAHDSSVATSYTVKS